jgi:hypothetical protein
MKHEQEKSDLFMISEPGFDDRRSFRDAMRRRNQYQC